MDDVGVFFFMCLVLCLLAFGVGRCTKVAQVDHQTEATVIEVVEKQQEEPNWYLTVKDDLGNFYSGVTQTLVKKGWRVHISAYENKILELRVLAMAPEAEAKN